MTTQTIMDTQGWTYLSLPNYGTLCRYLVRSDVWERLEAHCLNCGYHPDEHNCGAIDCEDYVAAPFTDGGFTKTESTTILPCGVAHTEWTGEVIHTATGQVVPLLGWTEEERGVFEYEYDGYEDWEDDQDCCLYLKRTTADEEDQDKDELNSAIDASGNCFHA